MYAVTIPNTAPIATTALAMSKIKSVLKKLFIKILKPELILVFLEFLLFLIFLTIKKTSFLFNYTTKTKRYTVLKSFVRKLRKLFFFKICL